MALNKGPTVHDWDIFWLGFIASLLAGLGTAVGAAWVLLFRRPSARTHDALLSAAAGVMLAATFFSLLQPGITYAEVLVGHKSVRLPSLSPDSCAAPLLCS